MAEEKEKFVLKLNIKSGKVEFDEYVESLHSYLLNWEASSIKDMILSLDETAKEIAKDLRLINSGEAFTQPYNIIGEDGKKIEFPSYCKLKILNDSKDSKVYDRVLSLVGKIKDFKDVCSTAESLRPEIAKDTDKPKLKIDPSKNVMEQLIKGTG